MINKAAVLFKTRSKLKIIKNFELPKISDNQVLVQIKYSSICGSQIMEIEGKRGKDMHLPHCLGHEGAGRVIEIGKNVKKLKLGDEVILSWIKSNGCSDKGINFKYKNIKINAGPITTFSKYSILPENKCIKKPKNLPSKIAAIFGCSILTGGGIVIKLLKKKKKNTKICLIGLGGVGTSTLLALKALSFNNISIYDLDKTKYKIFKKFNLKFLKNLDDCKDYYDYCFDSSGAVESIEKGIKIINNKGKLVISSHPDSNKFVRIYPHEFIKGKTIIGNWGGNGNPEKYVELFSNLYKKKKFKCDIMLSKTYSLNEINTCIGDFKKNKVLKPLIKMS